ncbi:MAG: hypothetical protein HY074_12280 [Deltaproteobacteria bacterium]|nr:hypothetical protein [Deltaproteobacteria bacterium]
MNGNSNNPRGTGSNGPQKREEMIRVDGRGQVLEMLRAADPEFREVLLRGIEKRDAKLARELRREL